MAARPKCERRFFQKPSFSGGISEKSISRIGPRRLAARLAFFERGVIRQCLAHEFTGNGSVPPEWLGVPR